jgi:hypothetical protein
MTGSRLEWCSENPYHPRPMKWPIRRRVSCPHWQMDDKLICRPDDISTRHIARLKPKPFPHTLQQIRFPRGMSLLQGTFPSFRALHACRHTSVSWFCSLLFCRFSLVQIRRPPKLQFVSQESDRSTHQRRNKPRKGPPCSWLISQ